LDLVVKGNVARFSEHQEPRRWRGMNLLGFALMEARCEIESSKPLRLVL
jgi:hypothetical protein